MEPKQREPGQAYAVRHSRANRRMPSGIAGFQENLSVLMVKVLSSLKGLVFVVKKKAIMLK
jgi:hypothetical protein